MLTHVRLVTILLVEDNEDHVILIKKALKDNGLVNDIRVVTSGEAALDYLSRAGEYADPGLLAATWPHPPGLEIARH